MEKLERIKNLMGIDTDIIPINEITMSRFIEKHGKNRYVIISAFRDERTREQNIQKNIEMQKMIKDNGFSFTKVIGGYIENKDTPDEKEVKEPSILIPNFIIGTNKPYPTTDKLKALGIKLTKQFDQETFLFKDVDDVPKYLNGSGGVEMSFSGKFIINPTDKEPYFTDLKGGSDSSSRFTLAENYYLPKPPQTVMGRHSLHVGTGEFFVERSFIKTEKL